MGRVRWGRDRAPLPAATGPVRAVDPARHELALRMERPRALRLRDGRTGRARRRSPTSARPWTLSAGPGRVASSPTMPWPPASRRRPAARRTTPLGNLYDLDGTMQPLGSPAACPARRRSGDRLLPRPALGRVDRGDHHARRVDLRPRGCGWVPSSHALHAAVARRRAAAPPGLAARRKSWLRRRLERRSTVGRRPAGRQRRPQQPGDWLRVDLSAPTTLVGVDLDLGSFTTDYPRGAAVEVTGDDGSLGPPPCRAGAPRTARLGRHARPARRR